LIGVARGDDPVFEKFKDVVAPEHMTPAEMWARSGLSGAEVPAARLRIVSIVFPYSSAIREAGRRNEGDLPPEIYCLARNLANRFIDEALRETEDFFRDRGFRATSGVRSSAFQVVRHGEPFQIYSNWSERHVAFAASLGTFSLHEGLITEAGCNVRLGSTITDAPLEVTPRMNDDPYGNCLHFANDECRRCIDKCPGGAILEDGHDKIKCVEYGREVRDQMCRRPFASMLVGHHQNVNGEDRVFYQVGCALCQFGVPCMDRNPTGAKETGS